ncbi:T9SS type A sorting domain-containing protein [Salinimicrobium sp. HB62]|uniref:T9SS type A sorting domain-containing protein n=1 Tax=Salinimicrobium sp. HB62 TaxID=3077781 RepID=UPI002D79E565|nr:T9SS type A sorting domain-containing protein [Salinimicrobium sp. HB62]
MGQIQSSNPGSWTETDTWTGGVVPGINDAVLKDVEITNDSVVIPQGVTIQINNLTIGGGGKLVVNGNLVVHQNILMENKSVGYSMGSSAAVIVYGNFEIKNQVVISLSSFLVIYGDLTKDGSSNQGDVTIKNGNIYVLGNVDGNGWPDDFGCTSGDYSGNTPTESENCDYGNEQDFEDNQEDFPDDLVDLINCYDLSSISATPACPGGTSTLLLDNSELNNVTFEWQVKNGESWSVIGSTSSVTVSGIEDFTKEYRVVVRPVGESTCRISISRNVTIARSEGTIWTGTAGSDWNNPANWSCNSLPTLSDDVLIPAGPANYPVVTSGANALAKNITIETNAQITVIDNWLRASGELIGSGTLNAESGGVSFEGTTPQIIPEGVFANDLVRDIEIDNPAGVNSQATLFISNSLRVITGSFDTGNALTLLSNNSGTAYIDGSSNGSITGTVKMQRYLPSGFGYKYFSSPFSTSVVGDFSPYMDLVHPTNGFPHFFSYNENREDGAGEDISGWKAYTDATAPLFPGTGYAANISDTYDPVTVEITGEVNKGNISLNLENNNGTYTKGFNLVGNPYPSPIDWNLVNKTGIDDAVYFFTAGTEDRYTGTYTSYINGVSNDGRSTNVIASMQGFFVRVSDPGTPGRLDFTDAARVGYSSSSIFYQSNKKDLNSQLILTAGFKDEEIQDALVLYRFPGATNNFEKEFDAQKLLNTSVEVPSFYTTTPAGEKLSINAIAGFTSEALKEIPLGLNALKSGEISLDLKEVPATLFASHLYLKDEKEKIFWDLSKGAYSFTTQKGEYNERFSLVLSPVKLNTKDLDSAFKTFELSTSSGDIIIQTRLDDGVEGDLQLISYSGQVLQQKKTSGKKEIRFEGLQTGIYLVTLRSKDGEETRKILIQQ